MGVSFANELDQLRAAHPNQNVNFDVMGDLRGVGTAGVFSSYLEILVVNAIKYGAQGSPVRIRVFGDKGEVQFEVRNSGPEIEPADLKQILILSSAARNTRRVTTTRAASAWGCISREK